MRDSMLTYPFFYFMYLLNPRFPHLFLKYNAGWLLVKLKPMMGLKSINLEFQKVAEKLIDFKFNHV